MKPKLPIGWRRTAKVQPQGKRAVKKLPARKAMPAQSKATQPVKHQFN